MRKNWVQMGVAVLAAGSLMLETGCVVRGRGRVGVAVYAPPPPPPPVVYVAPPPPVYAPPPVVVAEPVYIPDNYVWDGTEYVGDVNGQFYYLGPGNVWIVCGPERLNRFYAWQRFHPDWRGHYIRNDRYRYDRYGHDHPRR